MVNRLPNLRYKPAFWTKDPYRESYKGFVINLKRHIKYAGFKAVHNAIVKNRLVKLDENAVQLISKEIK